jgi:hypothetical protein
VGYIQSVTDQDEKPEQEIDQQQHGTPGNDAPPSEAKSLAEVGTEVKCDSHKVRHKVKVANDSK